MKLHPLVLALGFIPLVGCGGASEPITVEPTTYSVRAIDGYLRNALVWLDLNDNFQLDQGEPQAKSEEGGIAILDVSNTPNPENYSVVVKAVVGETVDEDSITESNPDGIATTTPFLLAAPAGQRVITPLSTLVNIKMGNGLTQQQATAEVATDLGIAEEALLGDYMASGEGSIAAKANALVELAVLPESEQHMQAMSQDDSGLDQELAANLTIVQALTEEQRLIKEEDGSVTVATNTDSDDDGVIDGKDAFPEDPSETADSDKDGKGDNSDAFPDDPTETTDSDKDGTGDNSDAFPDDPTETTDSDKDGTGDNSDAFPDDPNETTDSDKDGTGNNSDAFPDDPTETTDSDKDGKGNNSDAFPDDPTETLDSDKDGTGDNSDAFPDDPNETLDRDKDGTGDNSDAFPDDPNETTDSDNDGTGNNSDAFPDDSTETTDSDKDGTGDNSDAFPDDPNETLDRDKDGTGNNSDAFPDDPTETTDSDNDGKGNNSDAFPDNPNETTDSDKDGTGDNSDAFPDDPTETLDSDKDGTGDNSDAYINNAEKSVLDISTTRSYTSPVVSAVFQTPLILDIEESITIETFNNGDIYTEKNSTYTSSEAVIYGQSTESDQLHSDGSFTRIISWSNDFNLDGESQFAGKILDIGNRTMHGETYWRYIDEGDANIEGGDNGTDLRTFNNADFSARNHLSDLSEIDIIHKASVSWTETAEGKTVSSDLQQYQVKDFDINNTDSLVADYAQHVVTKMVDNQIKTIDDQRDWRADSTINQSSKLTITSANSYTFVMQRPIWANPTDGIDEEYADFNFVSGKADILTSYWYETSETLNEQGVFEYAGKRYVLNQLAEANIKLLDADNPDGLLFQEYLSTRKPVSDTESNEMVSWTHYPLADYDFTVDSEDTGQAYKVFQKQANGIWVGYSFPEWGAQSIVDLAGKVETARAGGTTLGEIDDTVIAGLSAYNRPITTPSFAYDESGAPRTWYFVSNNPALTDGHYSMRSVTLTDNGIKEGWLVLTGPDNFFLAQPIVEQPWDWFNAYQRHWLGIDSINTDSNNFMWDNWMGEFYLNESQAQARLAELQASHLFGSWANEYVSFQFNSDMTYLMEQIIDDGEALDSWAGTESGTFSYDNATGKITVTSISDDQNGTSGLSDYLHNPNDTFMVTSYEVNNHLVFSYTDGDESGEFTLFTTNLGPDTFSTEYLAGKTLYTVWFGGGDLANDQGQAIDENGNLISNPDDEISLTDVAVVQAVTFNLDGTVTAIGVKNAITMPDSVPYHYLVDTDGVLRIVEEQNEASEGNFICDNSHPDYLKTHFVVSDINGVEQFDNVDLFFFDKQKALNYAQNLSAAIAPCTP